MYGLLGKGTMAAHAHTHTDTPHTHTDTNKTLNRGWNLYGQLGQGTTADAYAPMPVRYFLEVGAKARRVCCGEGFSVVVCSEGEGGGGGELYSFGHNHQGQLGLGYAWATSTSHTPQHVRLPPSPPTPPPAEEAASDYSQEATAARVYALDVACGGNHTLVVRTSGSSPPEVFAWGANGEGQAKFLKSILHIDCIDCIK